MKTVISIAPSGEHLIYNTLIGERPLRGDGPKEMDAMAKPTMNRWIVVVCAILIQLALGAIYAWSVFTPGLTLPLEQEGFETDDVVMINGTGYTVELGGVYDDPVVDADPQEMTISIVDVDGRSVDADLDIIIITYITDEDGAPIEEVVDKGDTIYDAKDGATKYTYTIDYARGSTEHDVNLTANGNWHVEILITSGVHNVSDGSAHFLVNEGITGEFGFDKTQTQIVFATGLAAFAFMTIVAGKIVMPKIGPRFTAMLGGLLLGVGYIGAGAAGQTFMAQFFLIGLIGGAGIGLGYVVPIAVCIKWFPDKKGLITGLGVAGFGFGAFLWVQLGNGYLGTLIADLGTLAVFQLYGAIFLILVVLSSLVMVNPPEGYRPRGWKPPKQTAKTKAATGGVEFESGEMLRTRQFWTIWTLFAFGALAGLMVIGNIAIYGIDALQDADFEKAEAAKIAATAMALFAITNGLGRIAWGAISDKLGRQKSIFLMSLTQGILMIVFLYAGSNPWTFTVIAMAIGFNFGGNFTLFPTITADFFGNENVGKNYGFVFSSYGVGGIVGPILGGYASSTEAGFAMAFLPAGVLCLIGALLAFTLTPPTKKVVTSTRKRTVKKEKVPDEDDIGSDDIPAKESDEVDDGPDELTEDASKEDGSEEDSEDDQDEESEEKDVEE